MAGCLGRARPLFEPDDPGTGDPGEGDVDVRDIDARLHNETDELVTIALEVTHADDEPGIAGEQAVPPETTVSVPGVARAGEPQTLTATVGETTVSKTLAMNAEAPPGRVTGYVEVTVRAGNDVEISVSPIEWDDPAILDYDVSDAVAEPAGLPDEETNGLFVTKSNAAFEFFGEVADSEVADFVEETAFGQGECLLYLETIGPQTCYALGLEEEPHVNDGTPQLTVRAERTAPEDQACGDALTPVSLLLRLAFDPDAGDPGKVRVRFTGDVPEAITREFEANNTG